MTSINGNSSSSNFSSNFNASSAKENVTNLNTPETSPKKTITGKRSRLSASPDTHKSQLDFAENVVKKFKTNKKTQSEITTTSKTSDDFAEIVVEKIKTNKKTQSEIAATSKTSLDDEERPSLEQLKEKRKKSPLKTDAIKPLAKLFKNEREAKVWLAKQDSSIKDRNTRLTHLHSLKTLSDPIPDAGETKAQNALIQKSKNHSAPVAESKPPSVQQEKVQNLSQNYILELRDSIGKIIGYYKENKSGEKASGTMEQFIYEMACIFNVQDLFVATKKSTIQAKSRTLEGNHWGEFTEEAFFTRKIWQHNPKNDERELIQAPTYYRFRKGSFQPAHKGTTLAWYLTNPHTGFLPIEQRSLLRATLAAYLFGMYDAHANNILIDKKGRLKFFDNTRSLPNSNDFINWAGKLKPTLKCELLTLHENIKEMSPEEREMLKEELANYKSHFPELEAFMQKRITKNKLESLPLGWLDTEKALEAFKERIERVESALSNPAVKSSTDLIFDCNPSSKFLIALNFIQIATSDKGFLNKNNLPHEILQNVKKAFYSQNKNIQLKELIDDAKKHIPLFKLYNLCQNPNLTFYSILHLVTNELQKNKIRNLTSSPEEKEDEQDRYADEADQVSALIKKMAAIENKDISAANSCYYNAIEKLDYFEIIERVPYDPILKNIQAALQKYQKKNPGKPLLWINTHKRELSICFINPEGKPVASKLDLTISPGNFTFEGETYNLKGFLARFPDDQLLSDDLDED